MAEERLFLPNLATVHNPEETTGKARLRFPPTTTELGKEGRISDVLWCGENQALVGALYLQTDVSLIRSKPSHVLAGAMGPHQLKKIKYQFVYKNSQILYKRWL